MEDDNPDREDELTMDATAIGYSIGPTLYMPVTHHRAENILLGCSAELATTSIVLCLEDALHDQDVGTGLDTLERLLDRRARAHISSESSAQQIFLRPRNIDMAHRIADMVGTETVAGFVIPKLTPERAERWLRLPQHRVNRFMPTLETQGCFDPSFVSALADALDKDRERIAVLRIGGNDLLQCLGLRRVRGLTSYEGPLGWVLQMISSMLMARGYAVAAPVFDIIDDLTTLAREVARDVEMGFVSKTAIHPVQVPIILDAFAADAEDVAVARTVLNDDAQAVFQTGGLMCEPATHRAWADRVLARARLFGVREPAASAPKRAQQA